MGKGEYVYYSHPYVTYLAGIDPFAPYNTNIQAYRHKINEIKPNCLVFWDNQFGDLHNDVGDSLFSRNPMFKLLDQQLDSNTRLMIRGVDVPFQSKVYLKKY